MVASKSLLAAGFSGRSGAFAFLVAFGGGDGGKTAGSICSATMFVFFTAFDGRTVETASHVPSKGTGGSSLLTNNVGEATCAFFGITGGPRAMTDSFFAGLGSRGGETAALDALAAFASGGGGTAAFFSAGAGGGPLPPVNPALAAFTGVGGGTAVFFSAGAGGGFLAMVEPVVAALAGGGGETTVLTTVAGGAGGPLPAVDPVLTAFAIILRSLQFEGPWE